jgi:hypothetical protein
MSTCHICKSDNAEFHCPKCGRVVCAECTNEGICAHCLRNEYPADDVITKGYGSVHEGNLAVRFYRNNTGWVWLIIILLLFVAKAYIGTMKDADKLNEFDISKIRAAALIASKEEVNNYLKCPATAIYPQIGDQGVYIEIKGNVYIVNAYVDSDNSFGAKLRSYYTCELFCIDYPGRDPDFTLRRLIIDGEVVSGKWYCDK